MKTRSLLFCIAVVTFFNAVGYRIADAQDAKVFISDNKTADDPLKFAMQLSVRGMNLHGQRMKIISQNIANADVTSLLPDGDPYRRKVLSVKSVEKNGLTMPVIERVEADLSDFKLIYQPNHPAANASGYVKYPNVESVVEVVDAKEAQRSFEANVNSMSISKSMAYRSLDLLK